MKKLWIVLLILAICAVLVWGGLRLYTNHQMRKIPNMTFSEALRYTTRNNSKAVITVGYIQDGVMTCKAYGENGQELDGDKAHIYEIGSITKTFTAALINKAAAEGKLDISHTIDAYLPLPSGGSYPTIKEILTHTSGYEGYYFENPMISNIFRGKNTFFGVTKDMVLKNAGNRDPEKHDFAYSNYGYSVLGLVLESVYGTDYTSLVNDFCQEELGLKHTKISDKTGDFANYWDWKDQDGYLPAGGITLDIWDMLSYAQIQLAEEGYFGDCHKSLAVINATSELYRAWNIGLDEIGMSWIIDRTNGVLWHNGGTSSFNSYLGFRPETGTAVVVLSNLAPNYRIPATVLGAKLLTELDQERIVR